MPKQISPPSASALPRPGSISVGAMPSSIAAWPSTDADDAPREAGAPARGAGFLQHRGEADAVRDDEHRSPADRVDHRGGREGRDAEAHLDAQRVLGIALQPRDRREVQRRRHDEQDDAGSRTACRRPRPSTRNQQNAAAASGHRGVDREERAPAREPRALRAAPRARIAPRFDVRLVPWFCAVTVSTCRPSAGSDGDLSV